MKKVSKKNILKLVISLCIILLISTLSLSYASGSVDTGKIIGVFENKVGKGNIQDQTLISTTQKVLSWIQFISVAILIAALIIAGAIMIINSQDAKKKAGAKTAMIGALVGVALVIIPVKIVETLLSVGQTIN